ncbi:MAG: hypothetical protein WCO63_08175 [Bacteroidota bacterium]
MPSPRIKSAYLLLGIILGIVIGGSVLWWQRNIYSIDWISFGKVKQLVNEIFDKPDDFLAHIKTRIISGGREKIRKNAENPLDSTAMPFADSLPLNDSIYAYYNAQALDYYIDYKGLNDTMLIPSGQHRSVFHEDSLRTIDSIHNTIFKKESETVKRDVILAFRQMKIIGLSDSVVNTSAYLDSLLTDDRSAKHLRSTQIRVEFWKSPINYKGYRLTKEKLVTFGITDYEAVTLEIHQQNLYLKNKNIFYLLKPYDNFTPLIPVKKIEKAIPGKK